MPDGAPAFVLLLTHGSAGSVDAPDVLAVRDAVLERGGAVARVTQPFRLAGRRAPGSAARQDEAWLDVVAAVRGAVPAEVPLAQAGRSNGARVACRTAVAAGARAVVALAFPTHPPGKPEKSRLDELRAAAGAGIPVLVINGDRDPFGVPEAVGTADVRVRPGERHELGRDPAAVGAIAGDWLSVTLAQDHQK
jgi:predicted alpha/beta-hydrolase family hydrolase